jgi:hypothetical protein
MEVWKKIKGTEHDLEVSSKGNVRGFNVPIGNRWGLNLLKDKTYKQSKTQYGYSCVRIIMKGNINKRYFVHRLVAEAFIPNPENKPQVNHINSNKRDNRIENLEWVNNSENQLHAYSNGKVGAYKGKFGKDHNQSKPVLCLKDVVVLEFENISRASEYLNVSVQAVSQAIRFSNRKCKGFNLMYL